MKKSLVLSGLIALSAVSLTACGASGDVPDGRYYTNDGSGTYVESINNGEQCNFHRGYENSDALIKPDTNYDCVFDKENKEFSVPMGGGAPAPYEVKGNDLILGENDASSESETLTREDY